MKAHVAFVSVVCAGGGGFIGVTNSLQPSHFWIRRSVQIRLDLFRFNPNEVGGVVVAGAAVAAAATKVHRRHRVAVVVSASFVSVV